MCERTCGECEYFVYRSPRDSSEKGDCLNPHVPVSETKAGWTPATALEKNGFHTLALRIRRCPSATCCRKRVTREGLWKMIETMDDVLEKRRQGTNTS